MERDPNIGVICDWLGEAVKELRVTNLLLACVIVRMGTTYSIYEALDKAIELTVRVEESV